MRTSKSTTARYVIVQCPLMCSILSDCTIIRNLCAINWVKKNPKGTSEEFATYFDTLLEAELKVC